MEILGVGPLEIILVIVLALVVLGPQDMVASARKMGAWVRKIARSELWREIMDTSREIRQIPVTLIRDSGLEETVNDLRQTGQMVRSEVGQVTTELTAEVQQTATEVTAEAEQARADAAQAAAEALPVEVSVTTPGVSAQPAETAEPQPAAEQIEVPPEAWEEAQGSQPKPYPFPPGEYPQVYPSDHLASPEGGEPEQKQES